MANIVRSEDHNGYHYDVYDNGTRIVTGTIQNEKADRNQYTQAQIGHQYEDPLEENSKGNGGHIVPASQNGTSDEINIIPQEANTNQKDIRAVEREESKAVQNGAEIQTERIAYYSNNSNQPDAFMINDTVTNPDGTSYVNHFSTSNFDESKISGYYGELDDADSSYDVGVSNGYTQEEYRAILEAADKEMDQISDYDSGWRSYNFTEDIQKAENTTSEDEYNGAIEKIEEENKQNEEQQDKGIEEQNKDDNDYTKAMEKIEAENKQNEEQLPNQQNNNNQQDDNNRQDNSNKQDDNNQQNNNDMSMDM